MSQNNINLTLLFRKKGGMWPSIFTAVLYLSISVFLLSTGRYFFNNISNANILLFTPLYLFDYFNLLLDYRFSSSTGQVKTTYHQLNVLKGLR